MPQSDYTLSIVIPAYNESKRILQTLEKINSFLSANRVTAEVLIVDDGSRDNTRAVVEDFIRGKNNFYLLQNVTNKGKGISIQNGVMRAQGKYVLFSDADLSTPIESVLPMMNLMGSYDGVIASRRLKDSKLVIRQPFYREFSGRVFSILVRLLLLKGFIDTQCGFKLFRAEVAKHIFSKLTIHRFGFDVEILFVAVKKGHYRIKEFPVQWTDSPSTTVRLLKDSINMFFDLLRVRRNDWQRKYE